MVTAEELVVALRSEGVTETRNDLEGVEGAMEDTAESAGESADQLQGFSERFAGAMTAAVAALTIGAAGLLSQVPVVGETVAGLGAIIDAFAFRLDGVLRPALGVINRGLFEFANFIFEAEGAAGVLLDAVALLVPILGAGGALALGIAKVGAALGTFASTAAGLSAIAGTLASAIGTVAGVIAGLPVALTAAVVGLAAFTAAYLTNFRGVRDTTNRIIGNVIDTVVGGVTSFANAAISKLVSFANRVRTALGNVAQRFTNWAAGLASQARGWGAMVIERFINGIESMLGALRDILNDLPFIGQILDLFERLSDAIAELDLGGEIRANMSVSGTGGGGGGGGGTGRARSAPARNAFGGDRGVSLDGRNLTESTGRYRSDPSRRRGL